MVLEVNHLLLGLAVEVYLVGCDLVQVLASVIDVVLSSLEAGVRLLGVAHPLLQDVVVVERGLLDVN